MTRQRNCVIIVDTFFEEEPIKTTVQKWGNSLALRIPRSVAQDARLHQGSIVDVTIVAGSIVVKPRRQRQYALAQLLRGVTKSNRHAVRDWGEPLKCRSPKDWKSGESCWRIK